jgi:hypothetical protein
MLATTLSNLSAQQLHQAANLRERIEALEKELIRILGVPTEPAVAPASVGKRRKRRFRAATRAKMAASMKARWAARKAGASGVAKAAVPAKKAKKRFSTAARARLSAAAKARWAKVRAAGKKRL